MWETNKEWWNNIASKELLKTPTDAWEKLILLSARSNLGRWKVKELAESRKWTQELLISGSISNLEDLLNFFKSTNENEISKNDIDKIIEFRISKYKQTYEKLENMLYAKQIPYLDWEKIKNLTYWIDSQLKELLTKNQNLDENTKKQIESLINTDKFTTKEKQEFNNKYKIYNDTLCNAISLDNYISEAFIEEESAFDYNKKWENGIGFMQLSQNPFFKISERWPLYKEYFIKIKKTNILELVKDPYSKDIISKILTLAEKWEFSKEWTDLFNIMVKNRENPYFNLLIGDVFLADKFANEKS